MTSSRLWLAIMISSLLLRRTMALMVRTSMHPRRAFGVHRRAMPHYRTLSAVASSVVEEDDVGAPQVIFSNNLFPITAPYEPTGDQPAAIAQLLQQIDQGDRFSILQGITGTGKTLVMSHVIAGCGRPTLVLCHNKTLAAQLARELRSFLGRSAVELFVSYYNHYVPESFVETTGKYIAKKSSVNNDIDILRHRATRSLMTRRDVVVVASVSCIYGLGLPKEYIEASLVLQVGQSMTQEALLHHLESMLYTDNGNVDDSFARGQYQVRSSAGASTIVLWPPHDSYPMQIELQVVQGGMKVVSIAEGGPEGLLPMDICRVFPAKHHVVSDNRLQEACIRIEDELHHRVKELLAEGKEDEANRLQQRVTGDLMMLRETGFCSGGENYSRHLAGRSAGQPPDTLMDYLGLHGDWLLMVDESHVTLPQLKAMYHGDQARKRALVKYGYRLPSALDNRPLREEEFWSKVNQTVFVSATPSMQERVFAEREPVEMMIRPTFVCDPVIEVRSPEGQLEDLVKEVKARARKGQRTLTIALTKRDAEDLSSYLNHEGVKSTYIHSDLITTERSEALSALQTGAIDCLVGVNLLREGLDLPQVSLVAILNADSEGFLRSETALLQTVGRAARNVHGTAIFYAKRVTDSMKRCMDATNRRRERQLAYNAEMGYEMRSTEGSSTMSIFELLKEEIEAEPPLEVVGSRDGAQLSVRTDITLPESGGKLARKYKLTKKGTQAIIETDHIPSSPGVYFWRDETGQILYIGKAVKLRSRVKSYLSLGASLSPRIRVMLEKAASVEFMLTPSDRDALVLESNLIKHHQPPFNVLLKDDEHYPYICASVGDPYPRFSIVPRREESNANNKKYRYFGPYTNFKEINWMMEAIEAKYDLRASSFLARHGSVTKEAYQALFEEALQDVFGGCKDEEELVQLRREYEEAGDLFDSPYNKCRDVVAVAQTDGYSTAVVQVIQLREGLVAGRFSYSCEVPFGLSTDDDFAAVIQTVLERKHYPSGEESADKRFSWFPDEVLLSHSPTDTKALATTIMQARAQVEPVRKGRVAVTTCADKGERVTADARALEFALDNVQLAAHEKMLTAGSGAVLSSLDGRAAFELAELLSLDGAPTRIECYDISHTQGEFPKGSRVVFIDGKPVPELYRQFNIKTVEGVDDYASLEEVLERRFRRAWVNGAGGPVHKDDPWALPDLVVIDGGPGQLGAAIKGMSKASVFPSNSTEAVSTSVDGTDRRTCVAVCALAKSAEQVYVYGVKDPVNDVPDSPALLLLRALRDESHRFALHAHRRKRSIRNGYPMKQ